MARTNDVVEAYEAFAEAATKHGFLLDTVTVIEHEGIHWLLGRQETGEYCRTMFPEILGTSKTQAARTLRNYAAALNAVSQLRKATA